MKWGLRRKHLLLVLFFLFLVTGALLYFELTTSTFESIYLSKLARELTYSVKSGKSYSIRFPEAGPRDHRLGYVRIPEISDELKKSNFSITSQAVVSDRFARVVDQGLFPIFHEKSSAGLEITDLDGRRIHYSYFPQNVFLSFESVPDLLVQSLVYIENRELLSDEHPYKNPAIEWDRLFKAVLEMGQKIIDPGHNVPGGSTLATQLEKFRHSPFGRTGSAKDKLQQMASASVRSYLDGRDTAAARKEILLSYMNSMPLAAAPGYGEVNGLGDGLNVWYGGSLTDLQKLLSTTEGLSDPKTAELYKQALSLFVAQRRPSYYLLADPHDLNELTNQYLNLMSKDGIIPIDLFKTALPIRVEPKAHRTEKAVSFIERKAPDLLRTQLLSMLSVRKLYELDRYDLTARSTLNLPLQEEISSYLTSLVDPEFIKSQNLSGDHLISLKNENERLLYSISIVEATPFGNLLRVQTDNFDQPLNIQRGSQLDLGSTAKLRTLITYLNIVLSLHKELSAKSEDELKNYEIHKLDYITEWGKEYFLKHKNPPLEEMLEAAMDRQYSANPHEQFFTGGGVHTFENFNKEDNGRTLPIRQALRNSVNLPFIRLMRDVVNYYIYHGPRGAGRVLEDKNDARRKEYLSKFAAREGTTFVLRFYRKYKDLDRDGIVDLLLENVRATPERLAQVVRALNPNIPFAEFKLIITSRLKHLALSEDHLKKMYESNPRSYETLLDRGYVARIHPLELWVANYLIEHEKPALHDLIDASYDARQEVYTWLFESKHTNAQNTRIRIMLETEAFTKIHREWKKVGYPFHSLVPSYATAIGSSADRPSALTELLGILVNNGLRRPTVMIDKLHFAAGTPFETVLDYSEPRGHEVLNPLVAETVKRALVEVVENGTARRVKGAFLDADGKAITMGGKTGTGDHRFERYSPDGRLISSRAVNRSATFTFFIGDRFFGTLVAFVHGEEADKFKFTSALPVQILKNMAPIIQKNLE